jgi:hypothetical protein
MNMLKTNKDKLVKMAVMGEVVHPFAARGYRTDFDGNPRIGLGMSGIKYNVSVGDLCCGYAEGEHIEPGLSISNKEPAERDALGVLGCIGNEVAAVTGDAKGAQGRITGKHGNFMVWFDREDQERINIGDKMRVKAWGVGLKIEGFDDVRVNKLDPELLEKMGMTVEGGRLVVPVTAVYPAYIMGSGYGMWPVTIDYDIQTTCPEVFDELGLKKIRFGDIVALRDQLNWWGRGYYKGAVTIGVVIHGWSYSAGHGPGVTTLLSAKPGKIVTKINPHANIAYYLGLREKPEK